MATEKQIQANRANGLLGGVKTEEGKAAVRLNAVSHGLLSKEVLIPGENRQLLAELRAIFMVELDPVGELETVLVERIISSTWRLRRTFKMEKSGRRSVDGDYRYDGWQNQMRYETAIERQIYKALHELERLQRVRLIQAPGTTAAVSFYKIFPPPDQPESKHR